MLGHLTLEISLNFGIVMETPWDSYFIPCKKYALRYYLLQKQTKNRLSTFKSRHQLYDLRQTATSLWLNFCICKMGILILLTSQCCYKVWKSLFMSDFVQHVQHSWNMGIEEEIKEGREGGSRDGGREGERVGRKERRESGREGRRQVENVKSGSWWRWTLLWFSFLVTF